MSPFIEFQIGGDTIVDLPDHANFFAMLHTPLPPRRVARLFTAPEWSSRRCGWTEYEVVATFAELIIQADSPILLNGLVADVEVNADRILARLREGEIAYTAESYGEDGNALREYCWWSP